MIAGLAFKNKRGAEKGFIMAVIIILLTLFLLFSWLYRAGYLVGKDYDFRLCQLTIQAQDKTKIEPGEIHLKDSPLQINCRRRYITLGEDEATQTYPDKPRFTEPYPVYVTTQSGTKLTAKYGTLTKNTVNGVFADSMRRCWEMVGAGQFEPFNMRTSVFAGNVCVICDQITIESATFSGDQEPLLTSRLETKMPNQGDRTQTYYDYLFTSELDSGSGEQANEKKAIGNPACLFAYDIDMNPDIAPGTYATIFFRSGQKTGVFDWLFTNGDGWFDADKRGTAGAIVTHMAETRKMEWLKSAVTGDIVEKGIATLMGIDEKDAIKYNCMNTYVVPAAKVRTLCDYVAN